MARSRTGMSFIRTGTGFFSVGMVLSVYFGISGMAWMVCNSIFLLIGIVFILDGIYWHVPAERMKKVFSYCEGDMEIALVDYGKTSTSWKKVVFSHDDL